VGPERANGHEYPAAGPAAGLATSSVPTATPEEPAGSVRGRLAGNRFASIAFVAVLDGERLAGLVPAEVLIAAPEGRRMSELMDPRPAVVEAEAEVEAAANAIARHGAGTGAVVDEEGRFVGLIPWARLAAVLAVEHDEDLARLGGYRAGQRTARRAAEESVGRRLWHRLPWLVVGLAGAMLSTVIVGSFEEELDRVVLLAFFVPAVVYMADSVGTQTETVMIRALAVGVSMRHVLRRELLTGLLVGLIVGAIFFPFAILGWGDEEVALGVALALVASCSIATAVAMVLPTLLARLGLDPAFGSGPLATMIQDLLSIVIYFAIAVPLAT
jgi:magnesium transporter